MRTMAVLAVLLLAGCASSSQVPADSTTSASGPQQEVDANKAGNRTTRFVFDVLANSTASGLHVYAFRAAADGNLTITDELDARGSKSGDAACFWRQSVEATDMAAIEAWQRGEPAAAGADSTGASWYSFVFGMRGRARLGGQDVDPDPQGAAPFAVASQDARHVAVRAGEWTVLAAGSSGVDDDQFSPEATWRMTVASDTGFETRDLGVVPFYCGMGWRDLPGATYGTGGVGFVGTQTGGAIQFSSPLGALFVTEPLDATTPAVGAASVRLADTQVTLPQDVGRLVTVPGPADVAVSVDSWSGYDVPWFLSGLWCPMQT